ncbi:TfuA-like protein [Amycolatopsis sp. lyj-109]|uniref:TfuA-like protein n=1 Tax=Amycolatopsis sp. lyj-109 TaxID=2789287 RepID=UPI00397CC3BF
MGAVHVFAGPSCPEPLLLHHRPDAVLHGPVEHGDLFSPDIGAGDTVVIVDGTYHHRLALRHKEILDALARGVQVLGAASIGALRAAELPGTGMTGIGQVYRWYRDGVFDGDDAVAVAHAEAGSRAGVNVPLVNLYAAVLAAEDEGVIESSVAMGLMAAWEDVYYPTRTPARVLAVAESAGAERFARWCRTRWDDDPAAFDQKRRDTLEAVRLAGTRDLPHAEPAGARTRDWRTEYHRRWRSRFATDDHRPAPHHRLAYQQLFNSDFPAVWWDFLHRSHEPGDFTAHVRATLGPQARDWLADAASHHRVTAVIRPLPDLGNRRQRELLLAGETAEDRSTAEAWLTATRRHLAEHPDRSLTQIPEATCARLLAEIWPGREPAAECGRRGLLSLRQAGAALRPFVIGYLTDAKEPAGV